MKKLFMLVGIILLLVIFYPKESGGGGGLINPAGGEIVNFERSCFGFERNEKFVDAYKNTCYGFVGPKHCYGFEPGSLPDSDLVEMNCEE